MLERLQANIMGVYTIWYRDVLRYIRDPSRIIGSLGMPLLFLFVFGTGISGAMSAIGTGGGGGAGGLDFRQFVFPGIVAMSVMFTALFSAISIVWDREFGFLKEVMVAPISRLAVVFGKVLGGSTVAILQGTLVLVLSPILGIKLGILQILSLFGIMFLLAAMVTSLGILIAARQKSMEGFQMIMNFLMMPMFFLSGALFPIEGVPVWMKVLTTIAPISYGVDPMRAVALAGTVPQDALETMIRNPVFLNISVMIGLAALFIVPAALLFSKRS